jgi:prepilin-type N-terminal cleavage/methylation domain-containing protein
MHRIAHNRTGFAAQGAVGRNCGFTLIEMLVTIGLIVLLLMLVGYPILTGFAYMAKGTARADAQSAARLGVDAMTRELAEAMYVFDPPPGGMFIAFLPTRGGLNRAAPITPEAYAIRYWRALRDPAAAYLPFYGIPIASAVRSGGTVTITTNAHHGFVAGQWLVISGVTPSSFNGGFQVTTVPSPTSFTYGQSGSAESGGGGTAMPQAADVNPFYLARSQIDDPNTDQDPWNDSGEALKRAVFWYPDSYQYPSGETWPTSQMGYPWLEAVRLYPGSPIPRSAYDYYRERAVGLTPDNVDYDVPAAGFSPARITEEALVPWTSAFPRDYSRYRARYGSWAGFGQWNPDTGQFTSMAQTTIKVYSGDPRVLTYYTYVNGATGHVWVHRAADPDNPDPSTDPAIYDTAAYPQRDVDDPNQAEFAFGIMYDRGEVWFDFPTEDVVTSAGPSQNRYTLPTVQACPGAVVVAGSTTLRVRGPGEPYTDDNGNGQYDAGEPYTDVNGNGKWDPGPVANYELYDKTPLVEGDIGLSQYAVDGNDVVFKPNNGPTAGDEIHVRYRYRNNPEGQLVVATYATKSIINIALTVSKRDIAARSLGAARQDVTLVAKVKIQNMPR